MTLKANLTDTNFDKIFADFLSLKRETTIDVGASVQAIIDQVRQDGDAALIELTKQFDLHNLNLNQFLFTNEEIEKSIKSCADDCLDALKLAADRIRNYHQRQLPMDFDYVDEAGVRLGCRWTSIQAVGLYVPGGTAAYPSSVLMNALPAKVARVERLVMVVPTPRGEINPLVLAAASIAGVDEIYRIGGAQAVAALAYGTNSIKPVDKIVGPGNIYVSTAKKLVFGQVGIDMLAGPSEVLVVADRHNDPRWIAADLLSQAEHDPNAQAILITDDETFGKQVCNAIQEHLSNLSRSEIAGSR